MRKFFLQVICISQCLAALTLDEYHASKGILIQEGYITEGQKNQFREELRKHPEIATIAEIGLNGGHSAEHFFKNCQNLIRFVSFDIHTWNYVDAAVDFLSNTYGNRFCFISGDSAITVPQFALDEKDFQFDLIYIDGNHSFQGCLTDIENCQKIATKKTLVWIDDYESDEVKKAVEKCVLNGILAVDQVHSEDRHWIEAHYRFNPYPFVHRTNSYYSHQPFLYEIAINTKGPIIEFGSGNGSTDLLHAVCQKSQRICVSVDDNLEWLNIFKQKYKDDPWHIFLYVPGKPHKDSDSAEHWVDFMHKSDLLNAFQFDVCFIDQHPFSGRVETLQFMKNKSKFIVLHDCDYFPMNRILGNTISPISESSHGDFDFSDVFKYSKIYFPSSSVWTAPPTLIGSDFEPILLEIDFNDY